MWGRGRTLRLGADVPGSSVIVVLRGLSFLVIVWQALWMAADPRIWPTAQASPVAAGAVVAVIACWALLVVAHFRHEQAWVSRIAVADVIVMLCGAFVVLALQLGPEANTWGDGALFVLAAGTAGFLLPTRAGIASAVAVVAGECAGLVLLQAEAVRPLQQMDVLFPLFAMAAGAATIGARRTLLAAALASDERAAASAESEVLRRRAEVIGAEIREKERLLHEVVLNPLVAVEPGNPGGREPWLVRLAAKCREAAQVLRDFHTILDSDAQAVGDGELASLVADAQAVGIDVDVDLAALAGSPARVERAVRASVREALSNALRHSGATHVRIGAARTKGGGVRAWIHDDGAGFDPLVRPAGFGLDRVIVAGMEEVGGSATVVTAQGAGTTVTVTWTEPREHVGAQDVAVFVVPVLAAFSVYCMASAIVTVPYVAETVFANVALVLYLATVVVLTYQSTSRQLTWAWTVAFLCAGAGVYYLQTASLVLYPQVGQANWGSIALVSICIVLAALGPRWSWVIVLVTWLYVQGDLIGELLSPGAAVLVASALFGRSMRRMSDRLERSRSAAQEAQAAERLAEDATIRMRQRFSGLEPDVAIALLGSIADGTVDPGSDQARGAASREERYLRAVMRLDPQLSELHRLASTWLRTCHEGGVALSIDVPADAAAGLDGPGEDLFAWTAVVQALPEGTSARLSAREEDGGIVVRLIVQIDAGERDAMRALDGIDMGPGDPGQAEFMWEALALPVISLTAGAGQARVP